MVEPLALRQALDDVDKNDVGIPLLRDALRQGSADVSSSNNGDFSPHRLSYRFLMMASAISLVPTAVWSSRVGFMS